MEMEEGQFLVAVKVVLTLGFAGLVLLITQLSNVFLFKPRRLRLKLWRQGINGPLPVFLYGNIPEMREIQLQSHSTLAASPPPAIPFHIDGGQISHAWPATVFPHIEQWRNEYGPTFMYSTGSIQILCLLDPDMVKEVSLFTSMSLGKPSYLSKDRGPLLGQGILTSNGPYWAHQRKIIAPEFYLDKIKVPTATCLRIFTNTNELNKWKSWTCHTLTTVASEEATIDTSYSIETNYLRNSCLKDVIALMVDSTTKTLQCWESRARNQPGPLDIRVDEDMRSLSADIISRACFGSSHSQGANIYIKLHTLQKIMSKANIGVPGLRHVPTKLNREIWRLQEDIDSMILKIVNARRERSNEKDLLQFILDAAHSDGGKDNTPINIAPDKFIIDNCKNIYFAGYETTAISASWCLMLLAAYPEWQAQVRAEVLEVCGNDPPDTNKLRSMKKLTMVLQEALRLYPPVANVVRETLQDINFKGIQIPRGINVQIIIPFLHHHPELWGPDAHQFKPERFSGGIAQACKIPQAYIPFGTGTRTCLGQHFAMAELKVILSLILSQFSFSLSPKYHHSPVFKLVIEAEHGVHLQFKQICPSKDAV